MYFIYGRKKLMKKRAMAAVSAVMCASMVLSACGSSASTSTTAAPAETKAAEESKTEETTAAAASGDVVTINIGFENTTEEPIGQAVEKWAELLNAVILLSVIGLALYLISEFVEKKALYWKVIDKSVVG